MELGAIEETLMTLKVQLKELHQARKAYKDKEVKAEVRYLEGCLRDTLRNAERTVLYLRRKLANKPS